MSEVSRIKNRITVIAAVFGLVVPLLCYTVTKEFDTLAGPGTIMLWPSSIMLIPSTTEAEGHRALVKSILVNVIWYVIIGRLLAWILLRAGYISKGDRG